MPPMPLAVTLCLDSASAARVEEWWEVLAARNIDADRKGLGYAPHVTLGIYPDDTEADQVAAALPRIAPIWSPLPVALAGFGVFPGDNSVLWAAPVATAELLDLHRALQAALPDLPVHPHYRAGSWMPHVTLSGGLRDPGRALAALTPLWSPVSGFLSRVELVRFRPVKVLASHILTGRAGDG